MASGRVVVLGRLIKEYGLQIGAEIGVGSGPTTEALLLQFPHLEWIGVDCFPAGFELVGGDLMPQSRQDGYRRNYHLKVAKFAPRLCYLDLPSPEAAKQIEDDSLDLVFIDGNHSYEGCKADILAWMPKVRNGGWLTGHDYGHYYFPGVEAAVKEFVPGFSTDVDYTWLWQVSR